MAYHPERGKKGALRASVRTAEQPAQTLNIDLCLVPASHTLEQKLPAVSCSSGRVVAEPATLAPAQPSYPGQVFAEAERPYAEAMLSFVAASAPVRSAKQPLSAQSSQPLEAASTTFEQPSLSQQAERLRLQRRAEREQRRLQDAAWRNLRAERRAYKQAQEAELAAQTARPPESERQWRELRVARRSQLEQRQQRDAEWREERMRLREQLGERPAVNGWIAILVVTDNCTRQCLGLPLFVSGAKVRAEEVVTALRSLLPSELQFVISDRGVHFTAQVFEQLARQEQFIHVVIARHRPQSNGIAERFVRSLKEWLRDKTWTSEQHLASLLSQFRAEHNDCPHQGIAIPGLSPNEFADRIWLF